MLTWDDDAIGAKKNYYLYFLSTMERRLVNVIFDFIDFYTVGLFLSIS